MSCAAAEFEPHSRSPGDEARPAPPPTARAADLMESPPPFIERSQHPPRHPSFIVDLGIEPDWRAQLEKSDGGEIASVHDEDEPLDAVAEVKTDARTQVSADAASYFAHERPEQGKKIDCSSKTAESDESGGLKPWIVSGGVVLGSVLIVLYVVLLLQASGVREAVQALLEAKAVGKWIDDNVGDDSRKPDSGSLC